MFAHPTHRHVNGLMSAALVVTLVGLCAAPLAFARITANTIDPVATVTDNGRHLIVTGPVVCTAGERGHQRVTVTQRSTGAVAEGRTLIHCTGTQQQWEVHAATHGPATFEEGAATAVAVCHSTARGDSTDAHQWLVNITLVGE